MRLKVIETDTSGEVPMATVQVTCPLCQGTTDLKAPLEGYFKWIEGKVLIQDAFPELSKDQRELLLSGICSNCWETQIRRD